MKSALVFSILVLLAGCQAQKAEEGRTTPPQNIGLANLEDLKLLPLLNGGPLGAHDLWFQGFSSADLSGINNDGFKPIIDFPAPYTRSFEYYDKKRKEAVLAEVKGAGIVLRIRFAQAKSKASTDHTLGDDDYDVRIYIDDPKEPFVSCSMTELVSGQVQGFPYPLVAGEKQAAGGLFVNVPLPFKTYFRLATTGTPHFHSISILRTPTASNIESFSPSMLSQKALQKLAAEIPAMKKANSESLISLGPQKSVEVASFQGPGEVTSWSFFPKNGLWNEDLLQSTFVDITYEDEEVPRVSCPLGLFFGSGLHGSVIDSFAFGRKKNGRAYCRYPMPFLKSFSLSIRNESSKAIAFATELLHQEKQPTQPFGYFSAEYRVTQDPDIDQDIQVLNVEGEGRIVGMAEDLLTKDLMVLEGDTRVFVDECRSVALESDGHETWWGWAWYRGPLDQPYQLPTQGYTLKAKVGDQFQLSFYRNMITDYIPFQNGIRIGFQHGPVNSTKAEYRTVVFFYHRKEARLTLTDSINIGQESEEEAHNYKAIAKQEMTTRQGVFEGQENRFLENRGYSSLEESSFMVNISPTNTGVRLLRLSDPTRLEQPQLAEVYVDEKWAGTWFQPHYNPSKTIFFNNKLQPQKERWLEDQFSIPSALTHGKSKIKIRMVSQGHWSEYLYRIYSRR